MTFSADWLSLREPFDHRARSEALAQAFTAVLPPAPRLLELGGGTGSGVRWLRPLLPDAHFWLLDHDPTLLQRVDPTLATPLLADVGDLAAWPEVDGVTLQALLDLVDLGWLTALADTVATRQIPVLAALSVDGRVGWNPSHPDDAAVQSAFRVHQLGDRGFGESVGIHAAAIFADLLRVRGFEAHMAPADWQIGPADPSMLDAMVTSTATAAAEVAPVGVDVEAWAASRRAAIADGTLSLRVGHLDVLGHPTRS